MTPAVLIAGGLVADGTGAEPIARDVLVRDGVVVDLLTPGAAVEAERLDATGMLVAPGFVDIHPHSDLGRISSPDAASRALQGITTEVIGNCGMSPAPLGRDLAEFRTVIGPIDTVPDLELAWHDTASYLEVLDQTPGATNLVPLLGHGSLRHAVMGLRVGAADATERATMQSLLTEALAQGFWGMSLGFMYAPGEGSDERELLGLLGELRAAGGLLASHLRAYSQAGLPGAIDEVLRLARAAEVPLEISHLRSLNDDGTAIQRAFELLAATEVDVQADAYPYLAGHTTLLQLLPSELRSAGVADILALAAAEPGSLAAALRSAQQFDASAITIARARAGAPEVGHDLAALASEHEDWAAVAERLLVEADGNVDMIVVGTRPEDAARVLADPLVSVASDGSALALDHHHNVPHPRSIGTFPRAFRELADAGMPLGAIVHKMTAKPAARLGLYRSVLAAGRVADLVVLDPARIADRASYAEPLVPPAGIHHVIVAGQHVVRDGVATGARPGALLRRQR